MSGLRMTTASRAAFAGRATVDEDPIHARYATTLVDGFVPHVTLARVKALAGGNEATVRDALSAYRAAHLPWRLTHVALYASVLTPDGAVHRVLTRAELGKAPPAASP